MIRVVLVDDQEMIRAGLRMILEAETDITVVGEAGDGLAGVEIARDQQPDLVLMDIRMPRMDGLEAMARLLATQPAIRVVVLTTFDSDEYVHRALVGGASGFLLKSSPPAQLVQGVRTAVAGDALLAPSITRRLIAEWVQQVRPPSKSDVPLQLLTAREREVLLRIGLGESNKEICAALVLSEATVKTHVNRIFAKLGLRDRVQAVVVSYECGLVRPGR